MNFNFYNSFVKFSVYISSISLKFSRFTSYRFLYNENTKFIKFHENRNNCSCIYTPTNEHTYQYNQYDSSRRSAKFRIFPKHSEESESKQEIEL